MKALIVVAEPCEPVRELRPEGYLGHMIGNCSFVEHLLIAKGRVVRARRRCEECILGQLVRSGHVISGPTVTGDGLMKFVVSDTRGVRRLISRYREQVVRVEEADVRGLVLSERQRRALALLADGAGNITGVARALGISKTAAWKLVRKSIKKIARLTA